MTVHPAETWADRRWYCDQQSPGGTPLGGRLRSQGNSNSCSSRPSQSLKFQDYLGSTLPMEERDFKTGAVWRRIQKEARTAHVGNSPRAEHLERPSLATAVSGCEILRDRSTCSPRDHTRSHCAQQRSKGLESDKATGETEKFRRSSFSGHSDFLPSSSSQLLSTKLQAGSPSS